MSGECIMFFLLMKYHSNVNITMNRYVHPTLELKRQNMQRLSCSFASAFVE